MNTTNKLQFVRTDKVDLTKSHWILLKKSDTPNKPELELRTYTERLPYDTGKYINGKLTITYAYDALLKELENGLTDNLIDEPEEWDELILYIKDYRLPNTGATFYFENIGTNKALWRSLHLDNSRKIKCNSIAINGTIEGLEKVFIDDYKPELDKDIFTADDLLAVSLQSKNSM
ncbi:hypothetical protein [Spongiimicrobium salis]|uniref:hypothetical protein n=1 Tax=Spongiimicrobium salis TaxID=1667022 RepID=UPI00374D2EBE